MLLTIQGASREIGYYSESTNVCSQCQKRKFITHFLKEKQFNGIEYYKYYTICFRCEQDNERKERMVNNVRSNPIQSMSGKPDKFRDKKDSE